MFLGIILSLVVASVSASVIFEDCGSAYQLRDVRIEGCNMRLPCYVTLGEKVPVRLEFFFFFASLNLDQDVVININHLNIRADVTPDPCDAVSCPVRTNAWSSFTSVMSVPSQMALNQRGFLRWRVYNERGTLVICYSVLVQTQSPVQKMLWQALSDMTSETIDNTVNNLDPDTPNVNVSRNYLRELFDRYYEKQSFGELDK
ncbi:uncharacterized protein LOC113226498 isoform X2 [Hyposmocoma kahamanoa]|uniref:uncharacterized protein LOC113226498 isoform X2 n=1 Tax=Hyposmocoma kahamanoa TaxID=1477025 RepID=UPI000E6D6E21|nr:uncharacterized protein LOC113226498 isoform X2 [Hyposmocoma kahamanoa]